jgi:hypothetical protein
MIFPHFQPEEKWSCASCTARGSPAFEDAQDFQMQEPGKYTINTMYVFCLLQA